MWFVKYIDGDKSEIIDGRLSFTKNGVSVSDVYWLGVNEVGI